MSIPIRFLLHVLFIAMFIPISAITIVEEYNIVRRQGEALAAVLAFIVLPYLAAIKIYPYRDEWVGKSFDRRISRIFIAATIPFLAFLAMAFCYEQETFGDSIVHAAVLPLVFYAGIYFYFRKNWKDLFRSPVPPER